MNNEWKIFGERLKASLNEREASYRWLADKTGMSLATIWRYANSERVPRASEIVKCAKALNVTCDYLIGSSNHPKCTRLNEPDRKSSEIPNSSDLISRQAAIDALAKVAREKFNLSDEFNHYLAGLMDGEYAIEQLPSAQPETGKWERLMMYLADLQLTYSPNWGANGCGDEKLCEFVTGLIEELEGWEDGGGA